MATDTDKCSKCEALEKELIRLQLHQQHLIDQLAIERQRSDALYLHFPAQAPGERALSTAAAFMSAPLRYRVIDSINEAVKRLVPGLHRLARASAEKK